KFGCAVAALINPDETFEVPSVGGRPPRILARSTLVDIVQPRVEEIFEHVRKEIVKSGFEDLLASGLVLTGGSTAGEGRGELAAEAPRPPARRGGPRGLGGIVAVVKSPAYATGVGLVPYGARLRARGAGRGQAAERGMWRRMRSWFGEMF